MAQPQPKPPPPAAESSPATDDPFRAWDAIRDMVAEKPSLSWMTSLRLASFENETATFEPVPGQRAVLHFVNNPARRSRLADALQHQLGRRVQIVVGASAPGSSATEEAHGENPGADRQTSSNLAGATPGGGGGGLADRRAALELPLVKDVLDAFPDAMLVDAGEDDDEDPSPNPPEETHDPEPDTGPDDA